MQQNITRNPAFWVVQVIFFVLCSTLAISWYPKAFPIVDFNLKMDRKQALSEAQALAKTHHWGPKEFRQAVSFDSDDEVQTFVELSSGNAGFSRLLKEGLYSPFTWRVRNFAEGKTTETWIRFTPEGRFYGFIEKLPDDAPGASLSSAEALRIAEKTASQVWKTDLSPYQLIEKSQEELPSHRVDHTFVYERRSRQSLSKGLPEVLPEVLPDVLGDGRYRLTLTVSGDRLTELKYWVKVPDAFLRKYSEMRSSNNTIAMLASVAMVVLYLFGCCTIGLYFLGQKRGVIWGPPLVAASIVAGLQALEQFNQLPLSWMSYNTAVSSTGFLLSNLSSTFTSFFFDWILLAVSFMAAESLSRKAFPNHPQLWTLWKTENASSIAILGRTLGGYLSVGSFFAFVVCIYLFGTHFLGWWTPSDTWFHPDGLASYFPWFTSISNSVHAGFWEEALFRAVPLASAALLGDKFGHKKRWIAGGLIVESLIFAAAHANYPAQPSYARVVELIIPSLFFGGIYLRFGLLPGILLHFTFDVISFSIPLFTASTPGIWINRSLVILISLIPLWIVLLARIKTGRWTDLPAKAWNKNWRPSSKVSLSKKTHRSMPGLKDSSALGPELSSGIPWSYRNTSALIFAGILCLGSWISISSFNNPAAPLEIDRKTAIELSRNALKKKGYTLSEEWSPLAMTVSEAGAEDRFVWSIEGVERYRQLLGTYLAPPAWLVRFVRFDTPVAQRAEEFQVYLTGKGSVYRVRHELPEEARGLTLEQDKTRKIALSLIEQNYGLTESALKEVSSFAYKLPARKDWLFTFSDPSIHLKSGEARIGVRIAGDQAISSRRFIHVPEEWLRKEMDRQNSLGIIRTFSWLALAILTLSCFGFSLMLKTFHLRQFFFSFGALSLLGLLNWTNRIPVQLAQFSTTEPWSHQLVSMVALGSIKVLFLACFLSIFWTLLYQSPMTEMKSPVSRLKTALSGYSIGIVGAFILTGVAHFLPESFPHWGKVDALDDLIPSLSGLMLIPKYVFLTLLLSWIALASQRMTQGWSKRQGLGFGLIFFTGFIFSGIDSDSPLLWLVRGVSLGLYLFVSLRYWIGPRLRLLPLTVGAFFLLMVCKQMALHPYRGVYLEGAFSLILILALSYSWFSWLTSSTIFKNPRSVEAV